jgi:hypothetical protein
MTSCLLARLMVLLIVGLAWGPFMRGNGEEEFQDNTMHETMLQTMIATECDSVVVLEDVGSEADFHARGWDTLRQRRMHVISEVIFEGTAMVMGAADSNFLHREVLVIARYSKFYADVEKCRRNGEVKPIVHPDNPLGDQRLIDDIPNHPTIWPQPRKDSRHNKDHSDSLMALVVEPVAKLDLRVYFEDHRVKAEDGAVWNSVLKRAESMLDAFKTRVEHAVWETGPLKVQKSWVHSNSVLKKIEFSLTGEMDDLFDPPYGDNEAYTLSIEPEERPHVIVITAVTMSGFARAMATLSQMVSRVMDSTTPTGAGQYTGAQLAIAGLPVRITDKPALSFRSLMVDTGRDYYDVNYMKSIIDGTALLKLNILHWHITDDQSFPFEIKQFPSLHSDGAYWLGFIHHDTNPPYGAPKKGRKTPRGRFYSQQEAVELVEYAKNRGVRLIPEIDMPVKYCPWVMMHHCMSWFVSAYLVCFFVGLFNLFFLYILCCLGSCKVMEQRHA